VVQSEIKTPAYDSKFSPVGHWVGTYTCGQGFTGGTLEITSLKGKNFEGTFKFYPTKKNPHVASGSYQVYGQYDKTSHRILINPGKWIKRPHGYYDTIIVGVFDPAQHRFSGIFQGINGCTSFEAKASGATKTEKNTKPKRKSFRKKAPAAATQAPASSTQALPGVPAPDVPAAAAAKMPAAPAPKAATPPPSPGIALPSGTAGGH
jgi:hypothetical protein